MASTEAASSCQKALMSKTLEQRIQAIHSWLKIPEKIETIIPDRNREDPLIQVVEMAATIEEQRTKIEKLQKDLVLLRKGTTLVGRRYTRAHSAITFFMDLYNKGKIGILHKMETKEAVQALDKLRKALD